MARDLSSADCAFRDEVRHFLATTLTPDLRLAGRRTAGIFTDYDDGQRWFRILAKKGWSVPHWPVEWGGCGWTSPGRNFLQRAGGGRWPRAGTAG